MIETEKDNDRQSVRALERGLEVLRSFKPGDRFLGNQELAQRTGLPKPTISRLTHTLTRLGYLAYSEKFGKYHLDSAVLALGYSFLVNMDVRRIARPLMRDLAEYAQASVALGVQDRLSMLYIEAYRSSATVTLTLDVGSQIPIATTSMGRALLCALSDAEREAILDQVKTRNEGEWPRIKAGIDQSLQDYAERGFCLSLGDWKKDVHAVAAPLIPSDGSRVLVFSCAGAAFQLRRHMLEDDIGPRLLNLVTNVKEIMDRQV
ncbi:IclR family transcriptional regulator [Geobacter sp. SVR]|uniref:IclR family transcriptional regulator n=1 Tax=Geobacter sp. SVR TaxID=2495594 RepID=UPI00143F00AD|nr:IclR family transcriptional regulator [Geobacter sp. SVR]BCS56033.1 transcriptional regulator [Geobacter sp. SVR]GCF84796.1 transcriptional regulator [Geobacter sp. SVR]